MLMNDIDIIDLFWARSEQAISALADKYGRLARSVAMNILRDRLDAEECVNDSYLGMWNSLPPNRPQVLPAFFARITRNLALNRYRHNTAQKRCAIMEELTDLTSATPSPEEEINLAGEIISAFLEKQDKQSRVLFVRRYYMGDSVKEASKIAGVSENYGAVKLSRMRAKLKEALEKEGIKV